MKKFTFPMDRVLAWRRAQLRLAEVALEQMHRQKQALEDGKSALHEERARMEDAILTADHVTGGELEALDSFRQFAAGEVKRMDQAIAKAADETSARAQIVMTKRRDLELLEKLKARRRESWSNELAVETQQLAEEAYLARWKHGR